MWNPMKISDIGFLKTEPTSKFKNRKLGFRGSVFTRDSIAGSAYMLRQFRPSVCPSVRHTGGSVKNG